VGEERDAGEGGGGKDWRRRGRNEEEESMQEDRGKKGEVREREKGTAM
jgi:hypothetical protein